MQVRRWRDAPATADRRYGTRWVRGERPTL